MSGMGKPGDGQAWVYNAATDSWIAGSTGGGGISVTSDVATSASVVAATPTFETRTLAMSVQSSGTFVAPTIGSVIYSTSLGNNQFLDITADVIGTNMGGYRRSTLQKSMMRFGSADETIESAVVQSNLITGYTGSLRESSQKWTETIRFFKTGNISNVQLEVTGSSIVDWSAFITLKRQQTFNTSITSSVVQDAPITWSDYVLNWYRGDEYIMSIADSSKVERIVDKSGNGRHLVNSSVTDCPTREASVALINNMPSFVFNPVGSNQSMTGSVWNYGGGGWGVSPDGGYFVFTVYIPANPWVDTWGLWDLSVNGSVNSYVCHMNPAYSNGGIRWPGGTPQVLGWANPPAGQPVYDTIAISTGSWRHSEAWEKGVSKSTSTNNPSPSTAPAFLCIGSLFGTYRMNVKIAEMVICSGSLPVAGRQAIESYFAQRYNIY